MRRGLPVLLLSTFSLVACDRITGAATQKILDAEAIGYACRVSLKAPEDCMKENEAQSPTSVLEGWKAADKDIRDKAIDPTMGKAQPAPAAPAPVAVAPAPAAPSPAKAASEKPAKAEPEKKTKH
jgi:hypothetical protein